MKVARWQLHSLPLIVVLTAWVAGLFFVPARAWLEPFATGPVESLSGFVEVPGAGARPGRAPLARIHLTKGQSSLLSIEARPGAAFSLQVKNDIGGEVVRVFRFSPRERPMEMLLALDSREMPERLRLTLWNRHRSPLQFESANLRPLRASYRWAPVLYKLIGPLLLILAAIRNRQQMRRYLRGKDAPEASANRPNWDVSMACLVFLFCFSVFRLAPVHQILDSKFISVVSHSLITSGTVALPADFAPAKRARQIYTLRPVGEKTYHFFASAPAVLNAPFVTLFEMSGVSPVGPDGQFLGHNEQWMLRFIAAFLASVLCAVLFLTARVWLPPGWALGLTLAFAFGSQILSTISRPFWSHSWSTLLLAGALLLLVAPGFRDRKGSYLLISTLLCWAYFCRPPLSLAIAGVAVFLFLARRQFLMPFLTTGMAWAGLFVLYSFRIFGSWLPPYFLSSHLESGRLASGLLVTSYPEGMLGTLFSPGRGLFVYVPMAALVLFVVVRRWRWIPEKRLAATAMGVCLAHWQLVSMFRNWWGGQSFGPRLMSDLVPWLFLLAALAVAALRSAGAEGRFQWTPLKAAIVALAVAASVFINARGAVVQETQRGAGIWNWRYPQFMAGLLPRPDTRHKSEELGK
jgi:hypothetical protein